MVKVKIKGAKVRIAESSHPGAKEHLGQEGTIKAITPSLAYLVAFPCGASWFYKDKSIVLV